MRRLTELGVCPIDCCIETDKLSDDLWVLDADRPEVDRMVKVVEGPVKSLFRRVRFKNRFNPGTDFSCPPGGRGVECCRAECAMESWVADE